MEQKTVKVDFAKIPFLDIDGNLQTTDVRKVLGNHLYFTGRDIATCELGKKIYHSEGEEEISQKEADAVIKASGECFAYIIASAIQDAMK